MAMSRPHPLVGTAGVLGLSGTQVLLGRGKEAILQFLDGVLWPRPALGFLPQPSTHHWAGSF